MWYVRDVLYAVVYVRVSCFVVRGCVVSRRFINVCNCDMFSVVNVYLDHLKFGVVCIDGLRYVCCSECNVVCNDFNDPPPALCNLSEGTVVKLCTLGVFEVHPVFNPVAPHGYLLPNMYSFITDNTNPDSFV